jgi:hypothetical protein
VRKGEDGELEWSKTFKEKKTWYEAQKCCKEMNKCLK